MSTKSIPTKGVPTKGSPPKPSLISLDTLRGVAGFLGPVFLLASLGYWLVNNAFDTPMRLLLAVGIVLVGIYVAIDPEDVWSHLTARGSIYGGNTLVVAVAFLGILGLLNVLGQRRHERWDLTLNKTYTLSEQTLQISSNLAQPVQMIAFYSDQDSRRNDVQDLLREYETRSNGKITYEFIDPEARPSVAQQYQIREFGTTILRMGDQQQRVTGTRESDFTTGLLRLAQPGQKKIYFTTGHNERRLDGFDDRSLSQLKTSLESDNFIVEPLNLFATGEVPADATVVVIADPRTPLFDEEKLAIGLYLDQGGHLLLLGEPRQQVNLSELVSRWNISIGNDPVAEDPRFTVGGDPLTPAVVKYPVHKITEQLPATVFPFTATVTAPKGPDTPRGLSVTNLLETSPNSWVETDQNQVRFDEGTDTRGVQTLAVAAEITLNPDASTTSSDAPSPKARIVIFGDADFVSNAAFRLPVGNRDLFLNAANWVAESEELISIRPKPNDQRQVFLTGAQQNLVFFSTTLFLPAIVFAGGVIVWWTRR
ncbi:MAG: GldG family protein [Chloroflexota bacterium]